MKTLITLTLLIYPLFVFSKIKIDDTLLKKETKRKISQFTHLQLAQNRFEAFVNCKIHVDKKNANRARFAECINEQFFNTPPIEFLIKFETWFGSDSAVSLLYDCPAETQNLAEALKDNPKDIFYCIDVVEQRQRIHGFIFFKIKDEKIKIYKIKI